MIADLKPYPVMKDSGVEWLGKVPEHWEVRRLKTVCSMQSGDGITATSIESSGVYPVYGGNGRRGYTSNYTHDGTFVLIGRQGALCGNVHIASGRFWASEHTVVTTPEVGHLPVWLGATLDAMNLNQYSIAAAQPGLSVERVLELQVPVPVAPEQAAIVRYLDHVDRRIQPYIRAKQKLIALLEEQKQAVIHQAVTGQIDVRTGRPYPAYKPSGVEWLGKVPEHWEMRRLKTVCSMQSGDGITATSIESSGVYPVYGGNGRRGYTSNYTHDGTFVLIGRQGALCGNVHIASGRFWASEHTVVTTPEVGHLPEWLGATLDAMNLNQYSIAAAQPGLSVERVLELQVPVPVAPEQAAIVRYLDKTTSDIDTAIDGARHQIELLQEYRTRLIADVVTGKLNVCEAAGNLINKTDVPTALGKANELNSGDYS